MNTLEVASEKISLSRQVSIVLADRNLQPQAIKADASGKPPTVIELLKVGIWRTPYHGDFMVTPEDLDEYVENFSAGVGLVNGGALGAPIDYKHEDWDKAAGWIKSIFVEGNTLMGNVEWTPAGAQMLADGEFKCFSPSFCPKGRGGWMDPQNTENFVDNVLLGGGLTNIPLFSDLKPIMASAAFGEKAEKDNIFFISASVENKEIKMPTLEEIRAKQPEQFTAEDKQFLAEHKADLTEAEVTQFRLGETEAPVVEDDKNKKEGEEEVPTNAPVEDAVGVPAAVAASIRSGESVVIKASTLKELTDMQSDYRMDQARVKADAHVKRGAIKADSRDAWAKRIMADATIEKDLDAIADNQVVASEVGASNATELSGDDATVELAKSKVLAARGKGETLTIQQALKQATAEIEQSNAK